jgi:hypothetical protein
MLGRNGVIGFRTAGQPLYLSQPTRWGCRTATSFLPARRLLVNVFAEETCRGAGKEDHEGKPQQKENNLEDPLALIEKPIPRKRKYGRGKAVGLISRHSICVNRDAGDENPILRT